VARPRCWFAGAAVAAAATGIVEFSTRLHPTFRYQLLMGVGSHLEYNAGADWLPTLADVAGYDAKGGLPLDGVSQWAAINAPTTFLTAGASYPRQYVVLGNSTNDCKWAADARQDDQPSAMAAPTDVGCGFAVHLNDGTHGWKLIKGYGGGPDTWCNTTAGKPSCLNRTSPAGGRCPLGWCLYDVVADPEEFNECSAQQPNVVKEMQARMATTLQTYTQYVPLAWLRGCAAFCCAVQPM